MIEKKLQINEEATVSAAAISAMTAARTNAGLSMSPL